MLAALAAGDAAVIMWWALMLLIAWRQPDRRWFLIGPTFTAGLALLNWLAASILTPFGYGYLGASDAVKFIATSPLSAWTIAAAVAGITVLIAIGVVTVFRSATQRSPLPRRNSR
jgi:hypothetical protein